MATKEKNLKNLLAYLLSPEDSSASIIGGRYQVEVTLSEKWLGRLKASLWIMAPIAISILIQAV